MGSFDYPITLVGSEGEINLKALVDTGATYTWIPRPILERIGARPVRKMPFALADGRVVEYELAYVTVRVDGIEGPTICIFGDLGTEPLLGVVTLEEFGRGVDPINQALVPITGRLKSATVA